jgi:hypothetical protein
MKDFMRKLEKIRYSVMIRIMGDRYPMRRDEMVVCVLWQHISNYYLFMLYLIEILIFDR